MNSAGTVIPFEERVKVVSPADGAVQLEQPDRDCGVSESRGLCSGRIYLTYTGRCIYSLCRKQRKRKHERYGNSAGGQRGQYKVWK